ncbi:hypothetical protein K456DRAFT_1731933 [Colletotrichum gloeosporioides 23]|nr:hypothetical protein K456DRAFT_1731933 [Colletotrichum gloeosporioides 23]
MQVPPIEKPIVGKGMLSAPKLSSWEAAFDGNRRRSRILQLPDEILFEIMQMVEIDDLRFIGKAHAKSSGNGKGNVTKSGLNLTGRQ